VTSATAHAAVPDGQVLRAALADGHGLEIVDLVPERAGVDAAAWSYRAMAADGTRWFIKLRQEVRPAAILVPRYLHDHGIAEIVASVAPRTGAGWLEIGPWSVLVAPLVDAPTALAVGLDLAGWQRLGAFAARLHAVTMPGELEALLRVEDFRPQLTALARTLDRRIAAGEIDVTDEATRGIVDRWLTERPTIMGLVDRVDELGRRLRAGRPTAQSGRRPLRSLVPCHADLHVGNVLVDGAGSLSIVDWDEMLLAPPERDLMFVRGSAIAEIVTDAEADAFERGYGPVEIDRELIAFYRIDWSVQDLAGFAAEVIAARLDSPIDRDRAARLFHGQFTPGGEVDTAIAADRASGRRARRSARSRPSPDDPPRQISG
jgi:spectinomycin phosphotransferase